MADVLRFAEQLNGLSDYPAERVASSEGRQDT
jgi:hypothetical protein